MPHLGLKESDMCEVLVEGHPYDTATRVGQARDACINTDLHSVSWSSCEDHIFGFKKLNIYVFEVSCARHLAVRRSIWTYVFEIICCFLCRLQDMGVAGSHGKAKEAGKMARSCDGSGYDEHIEGEAHIASTHCIYTQIKCRDQIPWMAWMGWMAWICSECDTWDLACWFCWWCCCWKWWRWDNFYCSFESAQLSEFTLLSHRMGKFLFLPQAWPISNHGHACFVSKYRWVDWCRFCCEGVNAWTGRGQDLDDKILSMRHALLRCSRKKMRSELQRWRALMINEVHLADRGMWHVWHVCRHMCCMFVHSSDREVQLWLVAFNIFWG